MLLCVGEAASWVVVRGLGCKLEKGAKVKCGMCSGDVK